MVSLPVTLLQSILVGLLGDFHFQAVRIYAQEKKLLHGYYVYEVTVQPTGGTCSAEQSGRVCRAGDLADCQQHPKQPSQQCPLMVANNFESLNLSYNQFLFLLVLVLTFKEVAQNLL